MTWLREFITAAMLLTRLPLWRLALGPPPDPARCIWAYPVVGAVVGGIGAGVYCASARIGLPPALSALWTLVAMMCVTGALHEDGVADTADGFGGGGGGAGGRGRVGGGGGRGRSPKLEIMRDSRIGTYGALALIMTIAIRGAGIAALARPLPVATALVAAGALGRGAIIMMLLALKPARIDGLGASLGTVSLARAAVGLALAAIVAFAVLPGGVAIGVIAPSAVISLAFVALSRRQIGGYSGDVLGAGAALVECVALTLLAADKLPSWRL